MSNTAPYPNTPYPTNIMDPPNNQTYPPPSYYGQPAQEPSPQQPPNYDRNYNDGDNAENNFVSNKFSDKSVRRAFIRKVYITLTVQLLITFALVCIFVLVNPIQFWIRRNSWIYYLAYAVFFVTYLVLGCIVSVRRKFPGNYICLLVFTLALSLMAGCIGAFHKTEITLIAIGITVALCVCITIFAIQTKIDFTLCSGLLFVLSCVLFLTGIVCLILYLTVGPSRVLQGVYGGIATLVFGFYLAYDTQRVVGGRKYDLDPEEYIFGALQLYVDVVFMFMAVVGIVNAAS